MYDERVSVSYIVIVHGTILHDFSCVVSKTSEIRVLSLGIRLVSIYNVFGFTLRKAFC